MKRTKIFGIEAVLLAVSILLFAGCGNTEKESPRTEISEAQYDMAKAQVVTDDEQEQDGAQEGDAKQEQDAEIDMIVIRQYSDSEKERMEELQESYRNETAKPEKMIQEADSADDVTEGTLCYIVSTGQFYLPDRELTDEELLEIIDCNFRIALNSNHKSQGEWDEIALKERAELEAKVKAAGGITEDKAIEIARKAMEQDLGEKAKELKIHEVGDYGWKAYLWDIMDWDEYKDKGEIGWFVGFDNLEDFEGNPDDWEKIENFMFSYNCTVNAVDGSICGAYSRKGFIDGEDIWYEH